MKCMNLYSLLLVVLIFVSCGSSNDASGMSRYKVIDYFRSGMDSF